MRYHKALKKLATIFLIRRLILNYTSGYQLTLPDTTLTIPYTTATTLTIQAPPSDNSRHQTETSTHTQQTIPATKLTKPHTKVTNLGRRHTNPDTTAQGSQADSKANTKGILQLLGAELGQQLAWMWHWNVRASACNGNRA